MQNNLFNCKIFKSFFEMKLSAKSKELSGETEEGKCGAKRKLRGLQKMRKRGKKGQRAAVMKAAKRGKREAANDEEKEGSRQ